MSSGFTTPQPETNPGRRRWLRTALGCVIVTLVSAVAAAVFVLEQVHTVVQDLSATKALTVDSKALAHASFGGAETLLLVGDDTRAGFRYYNAYVPNLANEMLLVRLDPSEPYISMMSIPRELWVSITPPDGQTYTNRLNSAYTYGATTLVQTIQRVTGIRVNHVIATTFGQFENAVNKLGCVYSTIDERYFHNNADGGAQYQNVDLQPGYQCLDGSQAEQFVSYRHTDTSQVRDARDQAFLLAAKQQYGPELSGNIGRFEKVFGQTVQTDAGLRSPTEILSLANLLISASGLRVRQVPFQASACATTCPYGDLTATSQEIQASVSTFLHGHDTAPTKQIAAVIHHHPRNVPVTATLPANVAAEDQSAAKLQFTAEFPRLQDSAGSVVPVAPRCTQLVSACIRNYAIHAPSGIAYPIYVEVFSNGELGQYYDVQGTTWTNAPLFAHPQQTLSVGGRTYELFYEGAHLETIAWRQYGAIYWIHNTLTDAVGNDELLRLAEATQPAGVVRRRPTAPTLAAVSAPAREQTASTARSSPGPLLRVGELIGIVLLCLGFALAERSRRNRAHLRTQLHVVLERTAVLEAQLTRAATGHQRVLLPRPAAAISGTDRARPSRLPARSTIGHGTSRTIYVVVLLLAVGTLLTGVTFALTSRGHSHARQVLSVPAAGVSVLNAGDVPNAAHRLALTLAHRRVHVVGVGNLDAGQAASYEVLYTPGEARQAQELADLMRTFHPHVAPEPHAEAEAATAAATGGTRPRLVVVIP